MSEDSQDDNFISRFKAQVEKSNLDKKEERPVVEFGGVRYAFLPFSYKPSKYRKTWIFLVREDRIDEIEALPEIKSGTVPEGDISIFNYNNEYAKDGVIDPWISIALKDQQNSPEIHIHIQGREKKRDQFAKRLFNGSEDELRVIQDIIRETMQLSINEYYSKMTEQGFNDVDTFPVTFWYPRAYRKLSEDSFDPVDLSEKLFGKGFEVISARAADSPSDHWIDAVLKQSERKHG